MARPIFRIVLPGAMAALVILGMLSVWTSQPAHACSCMAPPPPQEALEQSDEVFTGEVVEISEISGQSLSVRFSVSEVWKGVEQREIEVATPNNSAACGFSFEEGGEYLVYTNENMGGRGTDTSTGLCSRTADLANAGDDLDALGKGTPGSELTAADTGDDDSDEEESLELSAWLLGGGASLVGVVLMALRFLRR